MIPETLAEKLRNRAADLDDCARQLDETKKAPGIAALLRQEAKKLREYAGALNVSVCRCG